MRSITRDDDQRFRQIWIRLATRGLRAKTPPLSRVSCFSPPDPGEFLMSNLVIQRRFKAAARRSVTLAFHPLIPPKCALRGDRSEWILFATGVSQAFFETADDESLEIKSQALNLLYRSLPSGLKSPFTGSGDLFRLVFFSC